MCDFKLLSQHCIKTLLLGNNRKIPVIPFPWKACCCNGFLALACLHCYLERTPCFQGTRAAKPLHWQVVLTFPTSRNRIGLTTWFKEKRQKVYGLRWPSVYFMIGDRWRRSYFWDKTLDDYPKIEELSSKDTTTVETIMLP